MRLLLGVLLLLGMVGPAQADPVTAGIAAVGAWYASLGAVGQVLVTIGLNVALTAASFGISYLLSGGGRQQAAAEAAAAEGIEIPEYAAMLRVRRLYGEITTVGGVFFNDTVAVGGSAPNHWILGLAVSEGICDSLVSVIINGVECAIDISGNPTTAPWYDAAGNKLAVSFRSGTDDQAIDPIILARFPSPPVDFYPDDADRVAKWAQFRQRGICTVVLDMTVGADRDEQTELWGSGGIPEIKLRVKGLRCHDRTDPRQDADDPTTWRWTDNATVCIEDFLVADIGGQVDRDDIDDAQVKESIGIDAEWLPVLDGMERRGRVNLAVSSDEAPIDVLADMLQMNRGLLRKTEGLYNIRADRPAVAVATIHNVQWLRQGTISFSNEVDTRTRMTGVVAQTYPPERLGEAAETCYPAEALDDPEASRVTFRAGDSAAQAQRLAFAMLTENGLGATVSGVFDISVLVAPGKANGLLEVGDVVNWDADAPYDDLNGLFKVDQIGISADFTVSLSLSGTSAEIINGWNVGLETPLEDAA